MKVCFVRNSEIAPAAPPQHRLGRARASTVVALASLLLELTPYGREFISIYDKKRHHEGVFFFIGIARFELTTSCSRSKRSTRLSYIPFLWAQR